MEDTKTKLKAMLVRRLKLTMKPEEIGDDEELFGDKLSLDSIDALELVVGLQKEFDCEIKDKAEAEKILVSIATIAAHIDGGV